MPRLSHLDPRLSRVLAQLIAFRRKRRPGTPVPSYLRQLVLAAVDSGVSLSAVSKQLGISRDQVKNWQGSETVKTTDLVPTPARILDVVSTPVSSHPVPSGLRVTYESGRLTVELSI